MIPREYIEPVELRGLVTSLASRWTDQPVTFVRNFGNLVYRIPGTPAAYLRITPETHRSKAEIESELQVVRYVGARGVSASQPVASRSGEVIHTAIHTTANMAAHATTAEGVAYSACVFTEARGTSFEESPPADEAAFFRAAGHSMGFLHEALSSFKRPNDFVRHEWTEDRWSRFAKYVPRSEVEAWELFTELRTWTAQLPTDPSLFGLVHGDFTIANIRIEGPRITLFDFDACCEHWRAYEIAAFLHYFGGRDAESRQRAYDNVLEGYAEALPVTSILREQIPLFGKMRLLYSFLVFAEEWGFENLTPNQHAYFDLRRRLFRSPPTWPSRKRV
jgi:Ser/Thr protein kinase RdoA (MazF antagonist)